MAETPGVGADTSRGCENPLDELVKVAAIHRLLDEKGGAAQKITDAARSELTALQGECDPAEDREGAIHDALTRLLQKKAEDDFDRAVSSQRLVFDHPDTQERFCAGFARHVSGEIFDGHEKKYRDPVKWTNFYTEIRDDLFGKLARAQRERRDGAPFEGNVVSGQEVDGILGNFNTFSAWYQNKPGDPFAREGILAPRSEAAPVETETNKGAASATIPMLLDASIGLSAEDKKTVEDLKAKLDAAKPDEVETLRKQLDGIETEYRTQFTTSIQELITALKPVLKAPEPTPEASNPSETLEKKAAREKVESIEKKMESERDLTKLAGFKKELEDLRTTYVTQKKEVGFWEKTIYKFVLGTGMLGFVRSLFGEKVYRGALDLVAGLANDGAIDDEETLFSHGIVKNQNGLFEVNEAFLTSNDAFLKEHFGISEEGLRKKLLKTKLKDFLEDKVDSENDTARQAYKDQIDVLKKVITEKTEEKDRGQTLDTFLKNSRIRSILIEKLKKLAPQSEPAADAA